MRSPLAEKHEPDTVTATEWSSGPSKRTAVPGGLEGASRLAPRAEVVKRTLQALPIVILVVLWEALTAAEMVPPGILPRFTAVLSRLQTLVRFEQTWVAVGQTVSAWSVGLGIALAVGLLFGVLLGSSSRIYRQARFLLDFLRSVPPIALLPVALLILGATFEMKLSLIVYAAVWIIMLQVIHAIWDIDPMKRDVIRCYRVGSMREFIYVTLPSVAPFAATGFRLAAIVALFMTMGSEFLGGAPGLGYLIYATTRGAPIEDAYAYGMVAAILALLLNSGLLAIERRLLPWHPSHRPADL